MYKIILFFGILIFAVLFSLRGRFYFNSSPSMPLGIWGKIDSVELIVGDNIVFCPTKSQIELYPKEKIYASGMCKNELAPMIKKVSEIHSDKYFVTGDHPRSFDSRVFGDIEKSQIVTKVTPLITWKG